MTNPIFFTSSMKLEDVNPYIYNLNKCTIKWIIKKIKIEPDNTCFDKINITVDDYLVNSSLYIKSGCFGWLLSIKTYNNSNLPKIWDEVNYLVESEDFTLITDKYKDWNFILASGEILQQEINACEVEKIKIEKDTIYIWFIWIWIFVLILLLFLLYKRTLKNKI